MNYLKVLVLVLVLLSGAANLLAAEKVLLVHSYHTGYPWVDTITEGVKKGLEGSGLELEIFYMDTKRKTSKEWKIQSGKDAMAKVEELKPVVVITADDNAQEFFAKKLAGKATPAVVFCGVNAEAKKYGFENKDNVTGILERPHFVDTIKMLQAVYPDLSKVAFMTDDGPTSDATVEYLKTIKAPAKVLAFEKIGTFDEWKKAVNKYNSEADAIIVFNYHTIKKNAGDKESMEPKDVIGWTIDNCKILSAGLLPFCVTDGCLLGIVESGVEHGFEAATRAVKIAKGAKASSMPISTAKKGSIVVNVKTAETHKIPVPAEILEAADEIVK